MIETWAWIKAHGWHTLCVLGGFAVRHYWPILSELVLAWARKQPEA